MPTIRGAFVSQILEGADNRVIRRILRERFHKKRQGLEFCKLFLGRFFIRKWLREGRGHVVIGCLMKVKMKDRRVTSARSGRLSHVSHMFQRVPLITVNATLRFFHLPSPRPTRFLHRDAPRVMYDEIVPDSEPEREEQRQLLKEERAKRTCRRRQAPEPMRSTSFILSSSPEPDLSALSVTFIRRLTQFHSKGLPSPLSRKTSPKQSDARSVISISGESSKVHV